MEKALLLPFNYSIFCEMKILPESPFFNKTQSQIKALIKFSDRS